MGSLAGFSFAHIANQNGARESVRTLSLVIQEEESVRDLPVLATASIVIDVKINKGVSALGAGVEQSVVVGTIGDHAHGGDKGLTRSSVHTGSVVKASIGGTVELELEVDGITSSARRGCCGIKMRVHALDVKVERDQTTALVKVVVGRVNRAVLEGDGVFSRVRAVAVDFKGSENDFRGSVLSTDNKAGSLVVVECSKLVFHVTRCWIEGERVRFLVAQTVTIDSGFVASSISGRQNVDFMVVVGKIHRDGVVGIASSSDVVACTGIA